MSDKKITAGPGKSDFKGNTNAIIQEAIESLGDAGGTVELLAGEYDCIDGIYMRSNIRLIGQGEKTVLKKTPGFRSKMAIDADYGQLKITPEDTSGFEAGMGVSIADNKSGGWSTSAARIVEIKDGDVFIDTHLNKDYAVPNDGFISNAVSLVKGYKCENASVENIVIEGQKELNFRMDGCRGGAIYWYKSSDCAVLDCEVRDYNGDAISFQITRNIRIENCRATGGTSIGLHPGTGSENVRVKNCRFDNNGAGGFFLCWRVQHGIFEDIVCEDNRDFGISIGHKDTDNLFDSCIMRHNGQRGLVFRAERDTNGAHRNGWRQCVIENNAQIGIEVCGITRDNYFEGCIIQPGEEERQAVAVLLHEGTENIDFRDCVIEGEVKDEAGDE